MKKLVSIGLFALFLYHMLLNVLVWAGAWWQAEHDLSERLLVYRSVDSLVEFQLPLGDKIDSATLIESSTDGFAYRGHYYSVVSFAVRGDTIHIAGLETRSHSFWQNDLLSFINDRLSGTTESHRKAAQLLKGWLKDYSPHSSDVFCFGSFSWRETSRIPNHPFSRTQAIRLVNSPPPQG